MVDTFVATTPLVRKLIAEQFPEWADLPLRPVDSSGTDNMLFRLGDELCARLPKVSWAKEAPPREAEFLPRFSKLPLQAPMPRGLGKPGRSYPWPWLVVDWITGEPLGLSRLSSVEDVERLADCLKAVANIDPAGGPASGSANAYRGVPLSVRDGQTRKAIAELSDEFDPARLTRIWETALTAPQHEGRSCWLHGDLQGGNILMHAGRLHGLIDFGLMGVGDPACDYMAAWEVVGPDFREPFRRRLRLGNGDWRRAAGWALSTASIALAYYRPASTDLVAISRRKLKDLLTDFP